MALHAGSVSVSGMNEIKDSRERWHRLGFYNYKNDLLPMFASDKLSPGASKETFPPGLASSVCAGGQQSLGVRSCLPQKHTDHRQSLDPEQAPDGYGRSAQILNRPGHSLGWATLC